MDYPPRKQSVKSSIGWRSRDPGKRFITYKLRDWLFSRQRYWGEPFPIIWRNGKHEALPESDLPVVPPPLDDYRPTGTVEPPSGQGESVDHPFRRSNPGTQYHAAMGRILLVFSAFRFAE